MKAAPALAVIALVLTSVVEAASPDAGARSVAVAQKALDTARANVATAVQRVEKDPTSTAELDAAHVAVEALKDALDSGAAFEAQDLDYARGALAARKELRARREYVEDRRGKIHIFEQRKVIDQALTALADRMKALQAKEPGPKDFDDARAAVAALKKAVDDGRQFTKQDEKFAAYVAQTDATMAQHQKTIDDRWALLAADKHRGLVKESRQALSTAVNAVADGGTDAQFDEANAAAAQLSKRLDEGKPLETRDTSYRLDADRARAELAQAKKKMEAALSGTHLARLKADIDPAYKDLVAASRAARARTATADQLAEAKTATIVVHKLVDKFEPQAALSQAFGQYLTEVKKTLTDTEVELERRALMAAQKDLTQALRTLDGPAATDERFEEAKTAQTILEKTLEATTHAKEPDLSAYVYDARVLLKDAPAKIAKRRVEIDVQRQKAKVEDARKTVNALMTQLAQPNIVAERLQEADAAIKQLGTVLEGGVALTKQDREYASYTVEVKKRIAELNDRLAARRVSFAASNARTALTDAITAAKAALETAKKPEATDADVAAAAKAVEAVGKAIETGTPLEQQNPAYAAAAERARDALDRLAEALDFAKQARAVRKQTAEGLAAGIAAAESAAGAKELRAQKDWLEKAVAQFKTCARAVELVNANLPLGKIVVLVGAGPSTPKDVIALCGQKATASEQQLTEVNGLIAFEEGPKRAYEKGKSLLAKSKNDALAQFYECISSGAMFRSHNPDLKERKFEVAGTSMTVAELIQECSKQRDAIKPAVSGAPMTK